MTKQFIFGAAMPVALLAKNRDWLIEHQRDLEIQDPFRPDFLDGDWQPAVHLVKEALHGHTGRVGIHGPFDGLPLMSFDPKVRELVSSRLMQGLQFAGEIGATHMVVHSPIYAFGHAFTPYQPAYSVQEIFARAHQTLEQPIKLAEQLKCNLVIENIQDLNPNFWMQLIHSFHSDIVRASIDVGHAFIMHQYGGATPDAFVRAAGDKLEHLHIQDTDGTTDRHWTPGLGNINWYALIDALQILPHNPRLILELRDYDCISAGAKFFTDRGWGM